MLPLPDNTAAFSNKDGTPSPVFYNWLKTLAARGDSGNLGIYNVKDYGASGDGAANDDAAINAAITAAESTGGLVFVPRGTFLFDQLPAAASNVQIKGSGRGITTLKLTADPAPAPGAIEFFSGGTLTNCGISDLTIDCGGFTSVPAIFAQQNTGFFARRLELTNVGNSGIIVQICDDWDISDNRITKNTADGSVQNNGILATQTGQNSYGIVARNLLTNINMHIDGRYILIDGNTVHDWKYGGGITSGPHANTHDIIVRGNKCFNGTGVDVDGTHVPGLELWGARTAISDNICFNNSGDGIVFGCLNATVTGNICYDNGQSGAGAGTAQAGIHVLDGGAGLNGLGSLIAGNRCFDSGGATQKYGLGVGTTADLLIGTNNLANNATADTNFAYTVATLPSAVGRRGITAIVTDANATTFHSIVAGGGANIVMVVSDGTNWRIGG